VPNDRPAKSQGFDFEATHLTELNRIETLLARTGPALRQAAFHARHSQTFIGAAHRARLARRDTAKAVKTTAHQPARLIYALLTQDQELC